MADQAAALKHLGRTELRTARGIVIYFEFSRFSVFAVSLLTLSAFIFDVVTPDLSFNVLPYILAFAPSIVAVFMCGALKESLVERRFDLGLWERLRKWHALLSTLSTVLACAAYVLQAGQQHFVTVFGSVCIQIPMMFGFLSYNARFLLAAYPLLPVVYISFLLLVLGPASPEWMWPETNGLIWWIFHGTATAINLTLAINWISSQASFIESKVIQANAALEEERERLRREKEFSDYIQNSLSEGVAVIGERMNIIRMNPAFEKLFPGTEVGGSVPVPLKELIMSGPASMEWGRRDLPQEDGRYFSTGCKRFKLSDDETGYILTMLDVTEQRRIDQEASKNERLKALGMLASSVAHDFNNYLAVIQANCELLTARGLDARHQAILLNILHSCDSASIVTRQLLSSVRDLPEQIEIVDAADVLRITARLLSHSNRFHVSVQLELEDEAYILIDALLLETMILNLFSNACDATKGSGEVKLSCRQIDGEVHIGVTDNGEGIAPELIEKVVQPFFTTKTNGTGTGLGLSTVSAFAARHHGRLELESQQGKGTTATLVFPAQDKPGIIPVAPADAPSKGGKGSFRILIVEDNIDLQLTLKELFLVLGHDVTAASDLKGVEALSPQLLGSLDVVFCDIVLREGFGSEVLRFFRRSGHTAVFVFMSGNIPEHEEQAILDIEPVTFLQKPLSLVDLQKVLQSLRQHESI
ncbi:hybrid sensor histidine kinase/response regulator [Roseibium sediminis]|uniref:hybrid sensor histidine kinase/response regulator n=1 Tax=Roseibium sediminis TaxID=1775174 RepID=UPI00123D08A4|nr:ATP-binding protein [Roseibium sediminis]